MSNNNLVEKYQSATKWSTFAELFSKLSIPLSNMILARIIAPEIFGVVATIVLVVSFAEMFSDSGFQKYFIQHDFRDDNETFLFSNVAFTINLIISLILVLIILLFKDNIALLVGSPGYGQAILVASLQIILFAFSSIQIALLKRDFNFKKLFYMRVFASLTPFFVTLPLAFLGLSYWAIIIGSISVQLVNVIFLYIKPKWIPKLYFNMKILVKMLSFTIWTLLESISIWLTTWVDVFFISMYLSIYDLGLFKTSTSMVNSIISIFPAILIPVLFSTLSRLKNHKDQFESTFLMFQQLLAVFLFPLGIGIFLYSDLVTTIILGSKWIEASFIIGIWSLTSSIMIVFSHLSSEAYRSKGMPKISLLAQLLHLVFLIPTIIIFKDNFTSLVYARSLVRFQFIFVHFVLLKIFIGISPLKIITKLIPVFISAVVMGMVVYILRLSHDGYIIDIFGIVFGIIIYFSIFYFFFKKDFTKLVHFFISKNI